MESTATYLTTIEAAAYLRLKERKLYDLAAQGVIPCTRVTGKLLFPRHSLDLWLMHHLEGDRASRRVAPRVLAGSQDPLLEWAVRESGSDLALLCHGSGDGVRRLAEGDAMLAGVHLIDPESGEYNQPGRLGLSAMGDLVALRWARRCQGLLIAPGNPRGIRGLADLARPGTVVAQRQPDAGAERLLRYLLTRQGVEVESLRFAPHLALSEDDLALAVRQGEADVGLGVAAAARRQGVDFLPLHWEPFDLLMRRRDYFEPPIQRLLAFTREPRFAERAAALGGYDPSEQGRVVHNA